MSANLHDQRSANNGFAAEDGTNISDEILGHALVVLCDRLLAALPLHLASQELCFEHGVCRTIVEYNIFRVLGAMYKAKLKPFLIQITPHYTRLPKTWFPRSFYI